MSRVFTNFLLTTWWRPVCTTAKHMYSWPNFGYTYTELPVSGWCLLFYRYYGAAAAAGWSKNSFDHKQSIFNLGKCMSVGGNICINSKDQACAWVVSLLVAELSFSHELNICRNIAVVQGFFLISLPCPPSPLPPPPSQSPSCVWLSMQICIMVIMLITLATSLVMSAWWR